MGCVPLLCQTAQQNLFIQLCDSAKTLPKVDQMPQNLCGQNERAINHTIQRVVLKATVLDRLCDRHCVLRLAVFCLSVILKFGNIAGPNSSDIALDRFLTPIPPAQ